MKFALVGGDMRAAELGRLLSEDGHRVLCFALEKLSLPASLVRSGCLQSCIYGADCVVLPCPAESAGLVSTPFSDNVLRTQEVISALWPHQLLCGGKFSDESAALIQRAGLKAEDLLRRSDFVAGNAAITAEGALGLLLEKSRRTAQGANVLICGWGRIGKLLAAKLKALGAYVTVAVRKAEDLAMARAFGLGALEFSRLEAEAGGFDWVVNTVPGRVISDAALCMMGDDTLLLELASAPGGFDAKLAENIGLSAVAAPGLPGKSAPLSAAMLMKEIIYKIINEQEERG